MTQKNLTQEGRKQPGWFSQRHQTNEAHFAAKMRRELKQEAKMERARRQNQKTAERIEKGIPAPLHFKESKRNRGLIS